MSQKLHFDSRVIHAGFRSDPSTGAVSLPIYATSTYEQTAPGVHLGYEYSRTQNPTRDAYEKAVADLEEGIAGYAFSSGMAAMATLLQLLKPGDEVIAIDDVYGGTYRLLQQVATASQGITCRFVPFENAAQLRPYLSSKTRMIWVESPTNPLLKILNLSEIASVGREMGVMTVADNTFASPYNQRPLTLGFDWVLHSATKYLNGHSDMVGGIVVAREKNEQSDRLRFLQNAIGAIQGPFDSFLAWRGLKTLSLRMQRHAENAALLAEQLLTHPLIEKIYYPGLTTHSGHQLAKTQMKTFGGMLSLVIKGGQAAAELFLQRLSLFVLAESLGGVESLACYPAKMTHAAIPAAHRQKIGIVDGLVRLSVGIENVGDLKDDIFTALEDVSKSNT